MKGLLLLQLGTPEAPDSGALRRFLRAFLTDPRVLNIPAIPRWLLVNLLIAPLRAPRSARAYARIWTSHGSPLRIQTESLASGLQNVLGSEWSVRIAMRYGAPAVRDVLDGFRRDRIRDIVALPLYLQEAAATTGSSLAEVARSSTGFWDVPWIRAVRIPPDLPGFVDAQASLISPLLEPGSHLVLSYHGLPERHVKRTEASTGDGNCLSTGCCDTTRTGASACYRSQCHATTRALAHRLGLAPGSFTTCFQSRLGPERWIGPSTREVLDELASRGARVVVATPGFVADCIETLEEMGMGLRERFLSQGGIGFRLAPCVNDHPVWTAALAELVRGS